MFYNEKMPIYKEKNEGFFERWTPGMAYIVGFFAADGTLTKGKRGNCFIEFCSCDREILEKIKCALETNLKIGNSTPKNKRWKTRYRIQIGSKKMFGDLKKLGFTQQKSKTLSLPKNMPNKFFKDFLRGYFDGDGHISICTYIKKGRKKASTIVVSGFTSGSEKILIEIRKKIGKLYPSIKGGSLFKEQNYYRLCFSISDSKNLYSIMYKNLRNNLFLSRKKKAFEKIFKLV